MLGATAGAAGEGVWACTASAYGMSARNAARARMRERVEKVFMLWPNRFFDRRPVAVAHPNRGNGSDDRSRSRSRAQGRGRGGALHGLSALDRRDAFGSQLGFHERRGRDLIYRRDVAQGEAERARLLRELKFLRLFRRAFHGWGFAKDRPF